MLTVPASVCLFTPLPSDSPSVHLFPDISILPLSLGPLPRHRPSVSSRLSVWCPSVSSSPSFDLPFSFPLSTASSLPSLASSPLFPPAAVFLSASSWTLLSVPSVPQLLSVCPSISRISSIFSLSFLATSDYLLCGSCRVLDPGGAHLRGPRRFPYSCRAPQAVVALPFFLWPPASPPGASAHPAPAGPLRPGRSRSLQGGRTGRGAASDGSEWQLVGPCATAVPRVLALTWEPAAPHQPPARSQSEQQAQVPAHGRRAHACCGPRRVRACGALDARSGSSGSAPVHCELCYRSGSGDTRPARRTS